MHDTIVQENILRQIASEVMSIVRVTPTQTPAAGGIVLHGYLHTDPEHAYSYLAHHFRAAGYTALLQQAEEGVAVVAIPGTIPEHTSRLWLALLLFALTVVSTTLATVVFFQTGIGEGLAFSASLLSILLAHEFGHYLMARRLGVSVSFPFFIPLPLSPIGTMGAFIAMKSPPPDRKALLAIAIAGPLAGLVVALPVLLIGLSLSVVEPLRETGGYMMEGNSLLYAGMKVLMFGQVLPQTLAGQTFDVSLHPVAFAGWVGLLVTGLNLIPAGQLDGGHILYALVGPQVARKVTMGIAVLLLGAGFLWWPGWFIWAILIVLLGRHRPTLLNELVPLSRSQQMLAIAGLVIFVLVFMPVPLQVVQL